MDLSITVNGMKFPNPFVLGSGPPGTNARVLAKSYEAGWGGAVAKTVSLESAKVVNVVPRYGKLRSRTSGEVIGFENIELISDRPIDVWLEEFRQVLVSRGQLKPNQELPAKEVKKLVIGKGSPQWTAVWNQASVASGLEQIGVSVGRGGDMSHKELLRLLRAPISELKPGETVNLDFAQLAQTASQALPASRLYGMGVTKKDLVKMALGGKGADKIAERVQLAIGTAQATASEQRVNPQLSAGGLQFGSQDRLQSTE